MGCSGSKHALHGGGGVAARAPGPRRYSGLVGRHSVALRSSTLGTLSLDRAAAAAAAAGVSFAAGGDEGMMKAGNDGGGAGKFGPSRSFGGWCPATPPVVLPQKRQRRVAPRTPNKTPMREPEEINVWELMEGLEGDDEGDPEKEQEEEGHRVERKVHSVPGSPVFDPDILDAFRKALDELSPKSPPCDVVARNGADAKKVEIQMFPGIVRERVSVLQENIDAKLAKKATPRPPPPPESTRRIVVYLTSLRGIRRTYEDCWSTSAILRSYGVRVDERDLSMHAGYKDELRAVLGGTVHGGLPQVFADGRHLGGAGEVRRMHEAGELASALEACEMVPGGAGAALEACVGCGGLRFMPCDVCSGSCKVFVVEGEEGAGAFRRCPECNENGLVRCPVC